MFLNTKMICVALKDGQLRIARLGKPYFPEPLNPKTIVLKEKEELFLTGAYPEYNTVLLNFEKYKKATEEYKTFHNRLIFWKINTLVFVCVSVLLGGVCLYQRGLFIGVCDFTKEIKKIIR